MVNVVKRNSLGGRRLQPGQDFTYNLTVQCSSLTTDCVNQTFTDVLPAGLDVTSLPGSTSTRVVSYDAATRTLSIAFRVPLDEPAGSVGLAAGDTVNFEIGMRLPTETPITTGTVIPNTASTKADNAPEKTGSTTITVDVPRVVRPVATKAWSDGSAVAGTDEASTVTLGIRNASSTSAQVSALTVTDAQPATFQDFDLTGATIAAFPAGADTAQLLVCTRPASACADTDYVAGPTATGTSLELPPGTAAGDVTGVRVRFTSSAGTPLPYDATGGSVRLGMVLRDTVRATGAPLRPTGKLTVNNCATPGATDAVQGNVSGAQACTSSDILPDTLNLGAAKSYVADTDGNFRSDNGEYAVIGANSRVSGLVNIKNNSPFPVAEVIIREPGSGAGAGGNEFTKLDTDKVRVRWPAGATSASLVVTYSDGSSSTSAPATNAVVDVGRAGVRVQSLELTYRGVNADGDATIAEGATAGLDLSGLLNDQVTTADLAGGASPGVVNCAGFEGSAGRTDGTGTAAGNACATLDVRQRVNTAGGTKTVGQTSVPLGQPIPFTLRVVNNGTLPLVDPVISDPPAGNDGKPDPASPNPFVSLRITGATITKDANTRTVAIDVFDPDGGAWVPFDAADTALLTRATGIRARMLGNLTPTRSFTLNLVTQRRDGTPDNVSILNCFTTSAGGEFTPRGPACAPRIQSGPVSQAASLNKSISPGTLPREVPGVPEQYADVILTLRNDGNLSMRTLQATDADTAFFDQVDFVDFKPVKFPAGADRIQIDALVGGTWVNGTPARTPALPAGVVAGTVQGVRATFSSSRTDNDGFLIVPCAAGDRGCEGTVTFRISPRKTLRTAPAQNVPQTLTNEVVGGFTTRLSPDPGNPSPIPPVDATLTLTSGTPKLDVDKTPNSTIGPGETAPFTLTVTNNGTANIPQLLVADVLPAGFAFDDTFVGDDGLPFTIVGAQVPAGTDPVPTPRFETRSTGDRISGLRFAFGDWIFRPGSTFQIRIQVGLEPGVTVGQTLTNTMGATSATPLPDLQCTAGDPVVTDGIFGDGEGTFCTHTATVTVKAGAAFSARKWVHGRDSLGWYNTRTRTRVAVGGAGCPSTADARGRRYTAYPCIALVNPGDRFDYLLRLVNAGTEPAREMRIVDKLPVQGDRGVILDQARLTEWDHRPQLVSEPVLDGPSPGTLTTLYTDGAVCADDLNLDPAESRCPAGDWDDEFARSNTGMQMRLAFSSRLAPGGSISLTFSMETPLGVDQVSDPTIAWNSFAHAETTVRGGGTDNYLPPTEPVKVGVGLQYGSLAVTKAVGKNPSDLPLDDVPFGFAYRCTILPQGGTETEVAEGELTATPGRTVTVPGIPGGASCDVWETQSSGGVSSATEDHPVVVTVAPYVTGDPDPVTAVTITNDFPDAVLLLRKVVTGDAAAYARDSYPVAVSCTFGGVPVEGFDPKTVRVEPGTTTTVGIPSGAECAAVEVETGQATDVSYDPAATDGSGSAPVPADVTAPTTVTITNELRAGGLQVVKTLDGPGAPELGTGPFTFDTRCEFDGRTFDLDPVTITGNGSDTTVESEPYPQGPDGHFTLPVGSRCTITEVDDGGADSTPAPVTVTVPDEQDGEPQVVRVGLTNTFSAGTLTLTKTLDGPGADAPYVKTAKFTVRVTCQREVAGERLTVFSDDVTISGGDTLSLVHADGTRVKVPLGSHCWAAETATGGATSAKANFDSYDNAAVVTRDTDPTVPLALVVTNTFETGSLQLTKTLEGSAASYADGRAFGLAVTCVLPQDGLLTPVLTDKPVPIVAGKPVTLDDLPVGARCWATEPDPGGATAVKIDAGSADTAVTVNAGAAVAITATNTFAGGTLEVSKRVIDGKPGPYTLALACTLDGAPVTLAEADRTFRLKAGESRSVVVPAGASCTVSEPQPGGATVSYTDSDGTDDGTVVVAAEASVTVTNTFPTPPTPTPTPSGPGTPTPPSPSPTPSGSGTPTRSGTPSPSTSEASGTSSAPTGGTGPGQPTGTGGLPNTGGPALGVLLLGLLATVAGAVLVRRRRGQRE